MKSELGRYLKEPFQACFLEVWNFMGLRHKPKPASRGNSTLIFFYFVEIVTDILARKLKYSKTKIRKLHKKQYKYVDQQEHFNDGYFQERFAAVAEDDRE